VDPVTAGVDDTREEGTMRATVGEKVRVHSPAVGRAPQAAVVIEVLGRDGAPPYRVRYADGHEATVFPGPDCTVERARDTARS
jgi:hypothetical protein